MGNLLEGIGRGQMNRIVMGKLGMDIDLLEGIKELAKREKRSRQESSSLQSGL